MHSPKSKRRAKPGTCKGLQALIARDCFRLVLGQVGAVAVCMTIAV